MKGVGAFYKREECCISTFIECAYVLSCQIVVLLLYMARPIQAWSHLDFSPFSYLLQKDWFAAYRGCTEVIPIGYFQDVAAFCHRQMGLDFRFYCKFVPYSVHERSAYLVFSRNTKIINTAQFIEILEIKTSMYKIFYGIYHRGATPKTARVCNRKANKNQKTYE